MVVNWVEGIGYLYIRDNIILIKLLVPLKGNLKTIKLIKIL